MTLRELIDLCDIDQMGLRAFADLANALSREDVNTDKSNLLQTLYGQDDLDDQKKSAEIEKLLAAADRDRVAVRKIDRE